MSCASTVCRVEFKELDGFEGEAMNSAFMQPPFKGNGFMTSYPEQRRVLIFVPREGHTLPEAEYDSIAAERRYERMNPSRNR